jgi:arabinofuranosyltransferase
MGASSTSPLFVNKNYKNLQFNMGIADERGFYYQAYGLISKNRNWPKITTLGSLKPKQAKPICAKLGAEALSHRENIYFVDICALSDPLLSQLPAIHHPNWRIGHQARDIPTNYIDAVLDDNILLQDKQVNELYKDIKNVTRGELFNLNRLKAIYKINTFDYGIDKNRYKNPINHN